MAGKRVDTATGRILLSEIVPPEIPFEIINHVMDKKALGELRIGQTSGPFRSDKARSVHSHGD